VRRVREGLKGGGVPWQWLYRNRPGGVHVWLGARDNGKGGEECGEAERGTGDYVWQDRGKGRVH
jgi:hypothetical protein